jgi:hypothetical protein
LAEQVDAIMRTDSTVSFCELDAELLVAEPVAADPVVALELFSMRPLISTSCPTWSFSSVALPSSSYFAPLMLDPELDVALPDVPVVAPVAPGVLLAPLPI